MVVNHRCNNINSADTTSTGHILDTEGMGAILDYKGKKKKNEANLDKKGRKVLFE